MPLGLVHVLLRGRHGPPRHIALGQVRARYSLVCGTLRWITTVSYCPTALILLCHMAHTNLATGLLLEADWTHVQLPNHPSKSHRPSDNIPAHRETNRVCRQRFPNARFFSFFFSRSVRDNRQGERLPLEFRHVRQRREWRSPPDTSLGQVCVWGRGSS